MKSYVVRVVIMIYHIVGSIETQFQIIYISKVLKAL